MQQGKAAVDVQWPVTERAGVPAAASKGCWPRAVARHNQSRPRSRHHRSPMSEHRRPGVVMATHRRLTARGRPRVHRSAPAGTPADVGPARSTTTPLIIETPQIAYTRLYAQAILLLLLLLYRIPSIAPRSRPPLSPPAASQTTAAVSLSPPLPRAKRSAAVVAPFIARSLSHSLALSWSASVTLSHSHSHSFSLCPRVPVSLRRLDAAVRAYTRRDTGSGLRLVPFRRPWSALLSRRGASPSDQQIKKNLSRVFRGKKKPVEYNIFYYYYTAW